MMKEKKKFQPLTSKNICQIYKLLHNKSFVSFPITGDAKNKVDSLVSNINSSYFGVRSYPTNEEKVVAYLYFIIKDHPFTDGNKSTASLSFEIICELNDMKPNYCDFSLDQLAIFIEQTKPRDYQLFIRRLADVLFINKI